MRINWYQHVWRGCRESPTTHAMLKFTNDITQCKKSTVQFIIRIPDFQHSWEGSKSTPVRKL